MNTGKGKSKSSAAALLLLWTMCCFIFVCFITVSSRSQASATGTLNTDYVYFRQTAGGTPLKHNGSTIYLRKGQTVTILDTSNKTWTKVSLSYSGKSYTGYVYASYISTSSSGTSTSGTTATLNTDYVYFRQTAGGTPLKHNGSTIYLRKGQAMTVLDTSNKTWTKVSLSYSGTTYTGYVYASYVSSGSSGQTGSNTTQTTSGKLNTDYVYFRQTPGGTPLRHKGSIIYLRSGQAVTILDTSNKTWTRVSLTYEGSSYTGYVYATYINATSSGTGSESTNTTTASGSSGTLTADYVYFRQTAGGTPLKHNGSTIYLRKGQTMTVLDTSDKTWTKVSLTYGGKSYTGYVYASYIKVTTSGTGSGSENSSTVKAGQIKSGESYVYFRQTPAGTPITHKGSTIFLSGGQSLTVLGTSDSSWYKVSLTYDGTSYTGYVSLAFVTLTSSETGNTTGSSGDDEFEQLLTRQGFPESYKVLLRAIHKEHPNWVFKAVKTNLDWNDVVKNEVNTTASVKNLVYGSSAYPNYGWRSLTVGYNASTDTYKSYDGSTWFAASDAVVTYYLDPRTYLTSSTNIFAFECLSYDSSQTRSGVEAILHGSFMYNSKPSGSTLTYSQIIIKAAQQSGVSPYHIASRIRQEIGNTITEGTSGKNSIYPGIYNFYNIGATDSADGTAILKGLVWAKSGTSYGRPWTTAEKSIIGGAQWLGEQFINKGQNTLYTQKFNVTYTGSLYSHQYMSNVQAPMSEAAKVYSAYESLGAINKAIVFSIPVYNNMPETSATLPSAEKAVQNNVTQ